MKSETKTRLKRLQAAAAARTCSVDRRRETLSQPRMFFMVLPKCPGVRSSYPFGSKECGEPTEGSPESAASHGDS